MKKTQESREDLTGGRLPQFGTEEFTIGNHGCQHVESFASLCLDEVPLPTWRPGAPVGVNLGEAQLINVGQSDFTFNRATPKLFDLDLSGSEGGFITFFFREWRGRFHTMPDDFNAVVKVPTFTSAPPLCTCWASSCLAVNGSAIAIATILANCSGVIFFGAPLRGKSGSDAKPRNQFRLVV